jgi:hypothetical protein
MASDRLEQAVQTAILASAHMGAYEQVAGARRACQRLGRLGAGRWRAAARDLGRLQDELHTSLHRVTDDVAQAAADLGIEESALWTAGDAAGELDYLHERIRELLPEGGEARRLLEADVLFGATIVEDAEAADRGTTLLFAWPTPLTPASWPWEATWVVGEEAGDAAGATDHEDQDDEEEEFVEELDLYATGDLEVDAEVLRQVRTRVGLTAEAATAALQEIANAFTRASLLAGLEAEDEDEPDGANGSSA